MSTNLPPPFPLPRERFAAQRHLLAAHVAAEGARSRRRPRLHAFALAASAVLAVLLVTPAFGLGERIVAAFDPPASPEEAEQQTGIAPRVFSETIYDGFPAAVLLYKDGRGTDVRRPPLRHPQRRHWD